MVALKPPTKATCALYGITVEDWWELLRLTEGRCPCCEKRFTQKRRPHIDHDHVTFMVRGLLCSSCNQDIGFHHDNAHWFACVAGYLRSPVALHLAGPTRRMKDAPPLPAPDTAPPWPNPVRYP